MCARRRRSARSSCVRALGRRVSEPADPPALRHAHDLVNSYSRSTTISASASALRTLAVWRAAVETSDDPVIQRQRRLGQALTEWRKAADLSQGQLARRLSYDRTTVAHAERGAQIPAEDFWRSCDAVLAAEGS